MDVWIPRIVVVALAVISVGGMACEALLPPLGYIVPPTLRQVWPIAFGILVGVPIMPKPQRPLDPGAPH
jgi:hypothetical protein